LKGSQEESIVTTYHRRDPTAFKDLPKPLLSAVTFDPSPVHVVFGFNYYGEEDSRDPSWKKGKMLSHGSSRVRFVNPKPNPAKPITQDSTNILITDLSLTEETMLIIDVDPFSNFITDDDTLTLFMKSREIVFLAKIDILEQILSPKWIRFREKYNIQILDKHDYFRSSLCGRKLKDMISSRIGEGGEIKAIRLKIPEDRCVRLKRQWQDAETFLSLLKSLDSYLDEEDIIHNRPKRSLANNGQTKRRKVGAAPLPSDQRESPTDLSTVFDDEENFLIPNLDEEEDQSGGKRDHEEGESSADKRGGKRGHEESESRPKKKFRESTKRTHLDILEESLIRASDMPPIVYEGVGQMTLILGMVYSLSEDPKEFGQEYRDQVRCKELEKLAFVVETVDDKHSPDCAGRLISLSFETNHFTVRDKHVQVKITSMRDFGSALFEKYQFNALFRYDHIMIDYFFAPGDEYRQTWVPFVEKVVPELHSTILAKGGSIWIPAWTPLLQSIHKKNLEELYDIYYVPPEKHPLYIATEKAEKIVQTTLKWSFTNSQEAPPSFMRMIPKYQNGQSFLSLDSALYQLGRHVRTHHMPEGHRQALGRAKSILPEQDNHVKDAKQLILESPELIGYEVGFTGEWVILEGGRICLNLTGESPSPKGSETSASAIGSDEEEIPSV
jgi:hypothetical protein